MNDSEAVDRSLVHYLCWRFRKDGLGGVARSHVFAMFWDGIDDTHMRPQRASLHIDVFLCRKGNP